MQADFIFSFFLIFSGAAVLATLALYSRQPLLIAYIALGCLLGPFGLKLVTNADLISDIAHAGIIFLLFLLGLDLQPKNLIQLSSRTALGATVSALVFSLFGFLIAQAFGLNFLESIIVGISGIFSSTIIGIKLLPTTVLHHKHTGEVVVNMLLLQDLLAIVVIIFLKPGDTGDAFAHLKGLATFLITLPVLMFSAFSFVKYVFLPLLEKYDHFQEYIFLMSIGWCLGLAQLAHSIGLSAEIGAFIAGISIASSPISIYIANSLKPLRDFFLVLFFFSLGAGFDLSLIKLIFFPALFIAMGVLILKPIVFYFLLRNINESKELSWEVGFRLGQNSEFSLLIAYMAANSAIISATTSHIIQGATILTFIISTYIVSLRYPSPIASSEKLRRD